MPDSPSAEAPVISTAEPPHRLSKPKEEEHQLPSAKPVDETLNVFTTVARHPALYRTWLPFCVQLLRHSVFPPRERELLIIRTASLCGCAYELDHHLRIGSNVGLTDGDLAALTGQATGAWTPREQLLVTAAEELHASHTISEDTWRGLSALLTTEQLVELPMLVGHYTLLAGTLRSLRVPLEGRKPGSSTD